jgi:ribosomal-protein-alanine N-acetyltransferase
MLLFETERCFVRKLTATDEEGFFRINGDAEVMKHIRPAKKKQECAQFLKENIQLYKQDSVIGRYLVLEKSTTQIMGMFSYLLLSDELNYHIGFALLPIFWGKGYALELVKFGVPYFFSHQPSNELYAITNKENAASQKVLLNSGFEATKNFLLNEQALDLYVIRK